MIFAERLKELRERRSLSREQLAEQLELSYSTISKYETGTRTPDTETLKKIADYFLVTTDWLLGRTDFPFQYYYEDDGKKLSDLPPSEILKRMRITIGDRDVTEKELQEALDYIKAMRIVREKDKNFDH